ncbi:MAG: hypothetical protein ACFFAQ_06255 [Promethearchaeota archaeon]
MANESFIKEMLNSKEYLSPIQYNLIKTLAKTGPLTRRDLVNQLRTPRTTIYDNLIQLQKRRMVDKFTRNDGRRGRPLVLWKIKD